MPSIVISNITEKVHVKMRSFQNEKAVITEVFEFFFSSSTYTYCYHDNMNMVSK